MRFSLTYCSVSYNMSLSYPTSDSELKTIVRDETSYEDTSDELPDSQLDTIIARAKGRVELETGSSAYYSDDGLGFALAAYTCMRAKSAVENISLRSYSLGDTDVTFAHTDPEDSLQLQMWAEDVRVGLDASSLDSSQGPVMKNTSDYIGETYIGDDDDDSVIPPAG